MLKGKSADSFPVLSDVLNYVYTLNDAGAFFNGLQKTLELINKL